MDQTITINEVVGFLKNLPTLLPLPDFAKVCALQKHMERALKQLDSPQSKIHGWSGLIMAPMVYALLKHIPFQRPIDPGAIVVYPQFVLTVQIKTIHAVFVREENEWESSQNIQRACFHMLDKLVADHFKVSNISTPHTHGVERKHVHHGNAWSTRDDIRQAGRNDVVCQWHPILERVQP